MRSPYLLSIVVITISLIAIPVSAQDHPTKASPFDAVRWESGKPQVQINDEWFSPVAINGLQVTAIVEACEKRWPGQLEKRFSEDLVEVMAYLGSPPGNTVDLELKQINNGKILLLKKIPNTLAKRQALLLANRAKAKPRAPKMISRNQALADLKFLESRLKDQFAYLKFDGIDLEKHLTQIQKRLDDQVQISNLATEIHRLMMSFKDGHASVSGLPAAGPYLPFLMADSSAGVVAFKPNRREFLDPEFPIVIAINDHSLDQCLASVRAYVANASTQLIRHRSLRMLRNWGTWRSFIDQDAGTGLKVELVTLDGQKSKIVELKPISFKPRYGPWPRSASRINQERFGYIRIDRMDSNAADHVHQMMVKFEDAEGLIVDVRGNGGGTREALIALAGYLQGPDDDPWVGNIAAYKLSDSFDADHLEARYMFPMNSPNWTVQQRQTIKDISSNFTPQWKLPDGFSEWHYLVVGKTGHASEYYFDRPVVILTDVGCFSATDIFLGALELQPNVTLMGTASGGGSARTQRFQLPNSAITISCASMASFRPNGKTYDGNGVEVDIEVLPDANFFLEGGKDNQLKSAINWLQRK